MTLGDILIGPIQLDLLLAAGCLLVFAADLVFAKTPTRAIGILAAMVLVGVFVASFMLDTSGEAFSGAYVGGEWPLFFKRVFLVAAFLATLGSIDHVAKRQPHRQGEYYLLLLVSVLGMMLLPGARDLILLIVCFELMGIPLYILATYAKADHAVGRGRNGPEAGLKLYLIGATSTAITLFGMSLVVGLAGSASIEGLARTAPSPLFALGVLMVLAGMGFKIGVVPFHMWVPDTYQGAPTPFVAFLSVAPKGAGLAALFTLFHLAFVAQTPTWEPVLLALTVLTLVVGNLLALPQTNVKRLLAYSGVAQIGYMLMAFLDGSAFSGAMVLFYLAAYTVTNIGAFLVIEAVAACSTDSTNGGIDSVGDDDIDDLDGLYSRSPAMAFAMLLFLLSLAGIPFVAGFWAKLYVFMAAWQAGYAWLVLLGALLAVVALFYYLQVVRAMYMNEPKQDSRLRVKPALAISIALCLAAVIGMGVFPGLFVDAARTASETFFN